MVDYVAIAGIAKTLIDANGRTVTILRFDRTLADTAKPWRGPSDPRATPDATATLVAVFVEPSSAVQLGISSPDSDLIKGSEQIMIVAPGAAFSEDLATFNEVVDGTINYRITTTETLKPGDITLLYFIGVKRR